MGIPRFFAFLAKTFPHLIKQVLTLPQNSVIEGLYVDLNTPIHSICQSTFKYALQRPMKDSDRELQNKFRAMSVEERKNILFTNIGTYLFYCYLYVKPKKIFMIAVDGVAPKAKMNQQRFRRFRPSGAPLDFFDSVVISPGTRFMDELDQYLSEDWPLKYKSYFEKGLKLIYSSHREPGEGEHKIFEQMNMDLRGDERVRTEHEFRIGRQNAYQVVLGADADLINLSMTRNNNIIFMRDALPDRTEKEIPMSPLEIAINSYLDPPCREPSFYGETPQQIKEKEIHNAWASLFNTGFTYVNITEMRREIINRYLKPNDIVDFTFISMFVGNDFLPALPETQTVTLQTPLYYTDDDVIVRYQEDNNWRRQQSTETDQPSGRGRGRGKDVRKQPEGPIRVPQFNAERFMETFKEKEKTWTFREKGKFEEREFRIDFDNAQGIKNHEFNRFEIFPLQREPLTGNLRRVMYYKSDADRKWRQDMVDSGALNQCLLIYKLLTARIRTKFRGESNTFIVERKNRINYINLLSYLKEMHLFSIQFMETEAQNYSKMKKQGKEPVQLVRLAVGIEEMGRRNTTPAFVPASYSNLHKAIAFGIYDQEYADVRLPKQDSDEMCRKWLEGAQWVLKYYSDGLKSINTEWFYPFQDSPSIIDLIRYIEKRISADVPQFPGIKISLRTDTVEVTRINIEGIVTLREVEKPKEPAVTPQDKLMDQAMETSRLSGGILQPQISPPDQDVEEEGPQTMYVKSVNSDFVAVIHVYIDEEGKTISLMETPDGNSKFVDLDQLQFHKPERRLRYRDNSILNQVDFGVFDPVKVNLVEMSRSIVEVPVKRVFTLDDVIYRVISDIARPYASVLESFFSIMPERTLKMILSPWMVDYVINQISDAFPARFEMITEGMFYDNSEIPKLPFLSPIRVQRALETIPTEFDDEIASLNRVFKRRQIMLGAVVVESKEIVNRTQASQLAQGYAAANVAIHTRKRQGKKEPAKVTEMSVNVTGGYGDMFGGVLPQFVNQFRAIAGTEDASKSKAKVTPEEGAVLAQFANFVFQIPDQLLMPSQLQINYSILPTFLPYRDLDVTRDMHMGQRKLLINEILFMNKFGNLANTVVYVGSAPGEHIEILSFLYPNHEFHLYDPSRFNIPAILIKSNNPSAKITIFNKPFEHKDALAYRSRNDRVLLISDLRRMTTGQHKAIEDKTKRKEAMFREEMGITADNVLQLQIVNIMNPAKALLKFRLPYILQAGSTYAYLQGDVWLQPWTKQYSAETRLVVGYDTSDIIPQATDELSQMFTGLPLASLGSSPLRVQKMASYDPVEYENKLYYHNAIIRSAAKVQNPIGLTDKDVVGLKDNWDCSQEVYVWDQYYLTKYPTATIDQRKVLIAAAINATSKLLKKGLDFQRLPETPNRPVFTLPF